MQTIDNPQKLGDKTLKQLYKEVDSFLKAHNLKVKQIQIGINPLLSPEHSILIVLKDELPTEEIILFWKKLKKIVNNRAEVFLV